MNLAYCWCWKMLEACICGSFRCRSCKMLLSSGTKSSDSWQLVSRKLWRPNPVMHLMSGQTTWRRPSICHSKWCFCRNSWRRLESTVVSVVFFVSFSFFKTPLHLQVLPKSWMILLYLCCVFFNLRTHFADWSFNLWTHFADRDGGYVGLIVHKVCVLCTVCYSHLCFSLICVDILQIGLNQIDYTVCLFVWCAQFAIVLLQHLEDWEFLSLVMYLSSPFLYCHSLHFLNPRLSLTWIVWLFSCCYWLLGDGASGIVGLWHLLIHEPENSVVRRWDHPMYTRTPL